MSTTHDVTHGVTRDDLHRMVDEVPADRFGDVGAYLKHVVEKPDTEKPPVVRRHLSFVGIAEGEPDLGERAREIYREELRRQDNSE